jgi:hypothetical protein
MGIIRRRLDICILYEGNRCPIEVKACRPGKDNLDILTQKALGQLADYLDVLGLSRGWLLIYHSDPAQSWDDCLYTQQTLYRSKSISIIGL